MKHDLQEAIEYFETYTGVFYQSPENQQESSIRDRYNAALFALRLAAKVTGEPSTEMKVASVTWPHEGRPAWIKLDDCDLNSNFTASAFKAMIDQAIKEIEDGN